MTERHAGSIRCAAVVFTFALCGSAAAQTITGVLTGVVVDAATQAPLPDATVVARSPALPGEQSAVTNESGTFEMTLLPAGTYSLAVTHEGFEPFSPDGLTIKGGRMRIRIAVAPVPPPVADTAIEFNDTMTMPSMVSGPDPEYTPDAVERGIEGSMQVRCVITADGQVRSCKVLKGLPFMNGAIVGALERRKYQPALAQGKPVDVYYTFNIRLKLPPR